ncbi:MAG: glycosyltransferase family 4 protein [Marinicaulis sp.]|nr:glycosyltransferase family 4 protein [Marinicaulis sp.]
MKFLYSHRTRASDGQYVHIRELTNALKARGHSILMAGPEGDEKKSLDAGSGGRGLRSLFPARVYECAEYGYSFPAYRRLAAAAKSFAPDVIYERYNLFYHAGAWVKDKIGLPLIMEVNAPLVDERSANGELALKKWGRSSENEIWRAADHVLPVTDALADYVRRAGVPENKITIIPNGVGEEFLATPNGGEVRARYGLEGKLVLGFTGFVRDWHGVDRVLKFIAGERRADLHLLLVGNGPERDNLETLARQLKIENQFTVTGVVQREEMASHVAAFDIALQPAVVEYASPLKLFEYMGLARAILAPASANIREVLTDGEDAVLFTPGNDAAFAEALRRLTNGNVLREKIGRVAKANLIRNDRTWAGNAARVEKIANELLEEQK